MTRREILAGLGIATAGTLPAQDAKLSVVDIIVGEFSTSMLLPPGFEFISGMPVYLSFRIAGFLIPEDNLVNLDYTIETLDAAGHPFSKAVIGRYARRVPRSELASLPLVRAKVTVPDFVHPGEARFRITVTDRLKKESTIGEAVFAVRSELPKPSGKFEILEPRLYRSEYDETPVKEPVYRPGEIVWTRFILAGFQWNEQQYDLRYGLSVLGSNGRVVLNVREAVAERNTSEYLKAYVPAIASFRLEASARPGDYTLVLTATDGLAKAEAKSTVPFRIQ